MRSRGGTHDVYNLEVEYDHVFHVTEQGVLGHNTTRCAKTGVDIKLKRPDGVSDEAWQKKLDALNNAAAQGKARVVHNPVRNGSAQRQARREGRIAPGDDADHALDLQFGGADDASNIMSTDRRVNRSVGGQGRQRMQHADGTPINRFTEE